MALSMQEDAVCLQFDGGIGCWTSWQSSLKVLSFAASFVAVLRKARAAAKRVPLHYLLGVWAIVEALFGKLNICAHLGPFGQLTTMLQRAGPTLMVGMVLTTPVADSKFEDIALQLDCIILLAFDRKSYAEIAPLQSSFVDVHTQLLACAVDGWRLRRADRNLAVALLDDEFLPLI